jgi:putative transposase
MGRLPRPVSDGLLYHALNRGNNRASVFGDDGDYRAFLRALAQTGQRYPFRLYGYCLMTNHFHLLLEPCEGQSISRILQSLTVAHTWRYHRRHQTVGHVWQGRFRSPVIQDDDHSLVVLRYIEGNPLRAGMVTRLEDYPWSSYRAHALSVPDPLLTPLPAWLALASDPITRQRRFSPSARGRLGHLDTRLWRHWGSKMAIQDGHGHLRAPLGVPWGLVGAIVKSWRIGVFAEAIS